MFILIEREQKNFSFNFLRNFLVKGHQSLLWKVPDSGIAGGELLRGARAPPAWMQGVCLCITSNYWLILTYLGLGLGKDITQKKFPPKSNLITLWLNSKTIRKSIHLWKSLNYVQDNFCEGFTIQSMDFSTCSIDLVTVSFVHLHASKKKFKVWMFGVWSHFGAYANLTIAA